MRVVMSQTVMVRYDIPPEEFIKKGQYDTVSPLLTAQHFPIRHGPIQAVDVFVLALVKKMSRATIVAELSQQGLRPADPEHLYAFGAAHLDERFVLSEDGKRELNVVALDQVWTDDQNQGHVPVLIYSLNGTISTKRQLRTHSASAEWTPHWHVLAVYQ